MHASCFYCVRVYIICVYMHVYLRSQFRTYSTLSYTNTHPPTHALTHPYVCTHTQTHTHTHTHTAKPRHHVSVSVELVHMYAYMHTTIYSCTYNSKPRRHVSMLVELVHMCAYVHSTYIQTQTYLETPAPCVYVRGASIHVCICTYHIYSYTYNSKPWCHVSILVKPVYMRAYVHTTYIQAHIHLETPAPCVYVSRASTNVCIYIYYVYSKTYIPRNYGAMCLC